ncbi:MAG: type IV toxin-antitoxin system AbiEi family antitoxin domain-containing protein [Bacteroides sp.]|nr:type IV toxin-antitoxin system AbiEi family antitoxin domain-containing protein [Bacteroides sp.]
MKSVTDKISQAIKYRKRGSIFFSSDFVSKGSLASVNKALSELTKQGDIIRLAPGIYCRPELDQIFGLGAIYPGLDEIAEAVASRDGARIVPTGTYAQNRLGLSTQIPMNVVFLTDGSPRRIKVYNGKGILFKKVAPRIFKFKNPLARMLTLALKDIGEGSLTEEQKETVRKLVIKEPRENFAQDYPLMPEWIRSFIERMYEEYSVTIA